MRFATLTLSALLFAAGTAASADDLTIVSKNTVNGKPGATSTSYIASDHVRMAQDGGHDVIIDLKTGVMTTLDGAKKTYYTTTKQDMDQFAAKLQEKMNDPEMKKGMEMMGKMSAGMAGPVEVKKTGETRKVAGFSCEEWVITMNEFTTMKECVTSELQYPVSAFDAYKAYSESMQKVMAGFGPMAKSGADLAEKMKAMKGYPVATSMKMDVMGQKTTSESEVTEVRKGAIPASAWEVPAGYTKIDNPMLKALDGRGRRRH
ncbi:MAG TPA: DUF4412 domain-containing protein [Vicinamibacterales bacterium]